MYIDSVIILSIVVVVLTCAVVVYVGIYAWKHIKTDVALDIQMHATDKPEK